LYCKVKKEERVLSKKIGKKNFVLVLKKRPIVIAAAIIAAAALIITAGVKVPRAISAAAEKRLLPIYSVQRDNKCVSLTFDAAWGNEDTATLIEILGKYDVKATFFVVGQWVDNYPQSVKQLSDAGHEVMNHSSEHDHFSQLSTEEIIADVTACNEKIAAITGVTPTLFRAPYGEYDDHVIAALNSLNMNTIQWDVDSLDWKELSADEIYSRVTSNVSAGSIILFHNAALHTPEALGGIIEYLLSEGYSIVPVSELILSGEYTIDHTGRQMPA
jgi:polysaccharide deacetylase family sporulation protein PdaB